MDNTSGSEDAELHALIYALKHGLLEANARFQNRIYVYKIVVYLDPMFLLIHLKEIYYRTGLSNNLRELYHVARLIEKAGIELELCWVSKRGKIRPHVIADEVVVEHQNLARVCILLIPRLCGRKTA